MCDIRTLRRTSLLFLVPLMACGVAGGQQTHVHQEPARVAHRAIGKKVVGDGQLTGYVRRIFQDSQGRYWFGSNGDGIYRYDPGSGAGLLEVFTTDDGLAGVQVTGILEDRNGHIWISTDGGVSRYDGRTFATYTTKDGLPSNGCWSIFGARDGTIWVGTAAGPCRFDGHAFTPFALPMGEAAVPDVPERWVFCMTQDRKGDLWFGTDTGAFRYDGRSFQWLTKKDGLGDNYVPCILVDRKDQVWFSSMTGGLSRWDGTSFKHFTAPDDIGDNAVWNVYEDRQGNIWFSSEGYGVYRYDGSSLRNYSTKQGLGVLAVQTIHQDREGRMWFGGGGGLYRLEGDTMIQVERNGPWQ